MSQNNTISGSARRNNSPELWIPYVLIGVSCVTFLAVHFWCYHKRNRERYLRKRDETRVKCGLLERRRITTLMLAKYQSDLGIIKKEKAIDLTRLFYDNSVDVIFDEYDYYRSISSNKHRVIHSSTVEAKDKERALSSSQASADTQTTSATTRAIASSQTWPLVTERKNTPYNAHRKSSKEDSAKESAAGTKSLTTTDSCDNDNVIYTSATRDKQHGQVTAGVFTSHVETKADRCSVNNPEALSALQTKPEPDTTGQTNVLLMSPTPTSYPRIFYTSLISSPSAQSSFFSVFTPKHKKRRYYSSSIEDTNGDQFATNENIVSKPGEFSRLHDADKACSVQDTVYISGKNCEAVVLENCEAVVLENCEKPYYRLLNSTAQGFSGEEALPFADGDQEYGSIGYNSEHEQVQMVPFYDHSGNDSHNFGDHSVVNYSCYTSQENPIYSIQSDNTGNVNVRGNTIVESAPDSNIENISSSQNRVYQQNVIIPFPEKSYFNIVSKNPGKSRANARRNDPTHISCSTPKPGKLTKRNTTDGHFNTPKFQAPNSRSHDPNLQQESLPLFDLSETPSAQNHFNTPKLQDPNSRSHDPNLQQESLPLFHLSETPSTQNLLSGFSLGQEIPANTESCVDYVGESDLNTPNNNETITTAPGKPLVAYTIPKTPTLRSLDRGLVFQNTKRKLGVNSE